MIHPWRSLRHVDPRLTANIYTRVDLGDMRTGHDKLGIVPPEPPPPRPLAGGGNGQGLVASLSDQTGPEKVEAPDPLGISGKIRGFQWSGRQDSNLRPLGPEPSALPG